MRIDRRAVYGCILGVIITCSLFIGSAYAEPIVDRIDIKVDLNEDGSANITESWNMEINSGSELSRTFERMTYSNISDFTVKDETGKKYIYNPTWDSKENRLDKFEKNGLRSRMNGDTVLYWGIGDYGTRCYTLEYKINSFIVNSSDNKQLAYINFVNRDRGYNIGKVTIEFENVADMEYQISGMDAKEDYKDDKIVCIESEGVVDGNEYLALLLGLNGNQFNCSKKISKSYSEIKDEYKEKYGIDVEVKGVSFTSAIIGILILVILVSLGYWVISEINIRKRVKNDDKVAVKYNGGKLIKSIKDSIEVTDDTESLIENFVIACNYNITSSEINIVSLLVMRWIQKGILELTSGDDIRDFKIIKKQDLSEFNDNVNVVEQKLFNILLKDIEIGSEIDAKALNNLVVKHANMIKDWINGDVMLSVSRKFEEQGLLKRSAVSKRVQKLITFTEFDCTKEMNERATKLMRFKDSGLNNLDKGSMELIYAEMVGATQLIESSSDEVKKFIMIINKITQICLVRIDAIVRANKIAKFSRCIDKIYEKVGL